MCQPLVIGTSTVQDMSDVGGRAICSVRMISGYSLALLLHIRETPVVTLIDLASDMVSMMPAIKSLSLGRDRFKAQTLIIILSRCVSTRDLKSLCRLGHPYNYLSDPFCNIVASNLELLRLRSFHLTTTIPNDML